MATRPNKKKKDNQPKVNSFSYSGVDKKGNKVAGTLIAENLTKARLDLRKAGIKVKKIQKSKAARGKSVTPADIALFTRQLATMMKAGVPLVQSFEIVADGLDNANMRKLVLQIHSDVSAGGTMASAMAKHPKYFDDLYISLIASGEQAGALETMLDRIALYKEKTESLKKKIKKAMTYPIAVLVFAIVVTAVMMVKVVPQFAGLFTSFGSALPMPTQIVVSISDWFQANVVTLIVSLIVFGIGFQQAMQRSVPFRHAVQRFTLQIPNIGKVVKISAVARYARTLSTTFAAGVPLVDALTSASGASGNIVYEDAIKRVRDDVSSGGELNVSMKIQNVFPAMLIQMVAIGEEAGSLDDMLERAANIYEEEVDNAVDGITAMIEPFIMAFLAVLVGGIVVSMYLPIFMMGSVV